MKEDRMTDEKVQQSGVSEEAKSDSLDRIASAMEGLLRLRTLSMWMTEYGRLEAAVTDDKVASMKMMIHEFIHPLYLKELKSKLTEAGYEERIRVILMRQRVYEYLMFVHNFRMGFDVDAVFPDAHSAVDHWLLELVRDRDFRMVHLRQGFFYPSFSEVVSATLLSEAARITELGDEYLQQALEMKRCAEQSDEKQVDLAYKSYRAAVGKGREQYRLLDKAGRDRGFPLPLPKEEFRYLWSLGFDRPATVQIPAAEVN